MFDFNQIEQFITIVEEGTISKAAEKLLISQPALSRSIQKLEEELNINLFNRTKNKIYLNDNGKLAYTKFKALLQQSYQIKQELQDYDKSHSMTHLASCAPAPIWAIEYLFDHQNIESTMIDNSHDMIEGLMNNRYSLIILNHRIESKDFYCIPLFSEKLYLSVVPEHKFASLESISFKQLNGESIILSSKIGFWSHLCQLNLPDSHLLYQDDANLQELVNSSTLPTFRTDITIKSNHDYHNRIFIPITDDEATNHYFLYYKKNSLRNYQFIKNKIKTLDWTQVL